MKTIMSGIKLVKKVKENTVVNNVSIDVFENEMIAIIGPNGAGKTTTIEMLLGIKKPNSGSVNVEEGIKNSIGAQLQDVPFFPALTSLENLRLFASFFGRIMSKGDAITLLTDFGLEDVAKVKAIKLSGGQQKKLAIAIATVHSPKVLFLDEPSAALDPKSRKEMKELLKKLNKQGTTIIFTSHDMEEVVGIADRIIFIQSGIISGEGTITELYERWNVKTGEDLYMELLGNSKELEA
ncbi:ABC transporter ATP-binding protein [Alkalihalobacillus pseudalcaliphilus]|uniref:ABC transporter ATP-binding protein n=1 Tax=Alkalihalobacillus pseudalcaliphilus TaxID=79884 RepID=UPI00064D7913|nr:ABC transporter ATP-binding protein [Alkalihalobacillus pseudalcaliphilus]KMK77526.1 hypothetical protein AB990_03395 [Alkalihalobacillus pseudalcaliphilus]